MLRTTAKLIDIKWAVCKMEMLNSKISILCLLLFVGHMLLFDTFQSSKNFVLAKSVSESDGRRPLKWTPQQIEHWSRKEETWFARNGLSYALKLLRLVATESRSSVAEPRNVIFSPIALKWTLLAIASIGDRDQEISINRFLFDKPLGHEESSRRHNFRRSETPKVRVNASDEHAPKPCLYLATSPYSFLGLTARSNDRIDEYQLQRTQKIKLCYAFAIESIEECLTSFIGDPTDFCEHNSTHNYLAQSHLNRSFTNAQLVWHQIGQFHEPDHVHDIPSFGYQTYLHRIAFFNFTANQQDSEQAQLWSRLLQWFQMKQFTSGDRSNETRQFESDRPVISPQLPLIESHSVANESILNMVFFDRKWKQTFNRLEEVWNFYPSQANLSKAIKLEMVAKHDYFGQIDHFDEARNRTHTLVRIEYENTKYSLVLLLPAEGSTPTELIHSLNARQLDYYLKRLVIGDERKKVVLTIPHQLRLAGHFDFGPQLLPLSTFDLSRVSKRNLTPARITQLAKLTKHEMVDDQLRISLQPRVAEDQPADASIDQFLPINRPFAYMLVGKYVDLHRKPAFDILLSGIWYGPPIAP